MPDGDGEALLGKIRDVGHEHKLEHTQNLQCVKFSGKKI
jgi:hypothetical protein